MRNVFFLLLIVTAAFCGHAEDITIPGFGTQLILTNPNQKPADLLKRTMGATKYKMTPGDTYQFTAQVDTTITVPIILDDNFQLEIPFLGTMDVHDMYFTEVRSSIIKRIKAKVPVQFVDFTLTSMALFDVLLYGGVENPGIATVTPLNTVWEALLLAKGIKKGASYRMIELVRGTKTMTIDLARFVREGELSQNPTLEPGDKIYVPHAQVLCQIAGNVKYPEFFEMVPGETLSDILNFAGGFLPGSLLNEIEIARLDEGRNIVITRTTATQAKKFVMQNGDRVYIRSINENKETILVEGALYGKQSTGDEPQIPPLKPVVLSLPFVEGITLLQVIEKFGGPTPLADAEKSYINRKSTGERILVDIKKLVDIRDPALDIKLRPDDHIFVPMRNLMVAIGGEVVSPGGFPYQTGTKVIDYVKLAGGLKLETADISAIYSMDDTGRATRISLETDVGPGALIYVGKSGLSNTVRVIQQLGIIVGFSAALIGITLVALDIIAKANGTYVD